MFLVCVTFCQTIVPEHCSFSLVLPFGFVLNFSALRWLVGMALGHFPLFLLGSFASGSNVFRCIAGVRFTFTRAVVLEHSFFFFPIADFALGWWGQVQNILLTHFDALFPYKLAGLMCSFRFLLCIQMWGECGSM